MMPTKPSIDLDEFRRLHALGWGCDRIARHFGVDKRWTCKLRRRLKLPIQRRRLPPSPRLEEAHAAYLAGGISIKAAEQAFGLRRSELHSYLRRLRETAAAGEEPPPEIDDLCRAQREETERQIAEWDRRQELARRAA